MKKLVLLLFILVGIKNTVLNSQANFYKTCSYLSSCSYTDEPYAYYIERNTEKYVVYGNQVDLTEWVVEGGTIQGTATNSVVINWFENAPEYKITGKAAGSSYSVTQTLYKEYAHSIDSVEDVCSKDIVPYSCSFSIDTSDPFFETLYDNTPIVVKWRLKNISDSTFIELGESQGLGNTISSSGYFIPNNHFVTNGGYKIVAEIWRYNYYTPPPPPTPPVQVQIWDYEPVFTMLSNTFYIAPSAPEIDVADIYFSESVTNRTNVLPSLSITSFDYGGVVYSANQNNWPPLDTFTVNAVTNNPDKGEPVGHNFLGTNSEITCWDLLTNIEVAPFNGDTHGFDTLKIQFEGIGYKGTSIDPCAFEGSWPIVRMDTLYVQRRPTCISKHDGSIVARIKNASSSETVTYKLFKCLFDANGNIINDRNSPDRTMTATGNDFVQFVNLEQGEYFVRMEKPPFVIEEYINLEAYPISMTIEDITAPTCYNRYDGSVRITGLVYNNVTYLNNSSLPTNTQFYVGNSEISFTGNSLPITLIGTDTSEMDNNADSLHFIVGGCSYGNSLTIPVKTRNSLSASTETPSCVGGGDGVINIDTIYYNDGNHTSNLSINPDKVKFRVYSDTLTSPVWYNQSGMDDFDIPYPINSTNDTLVAGNYWVSFIDSSGCESHFEPVVINNPDTLSITVNSFDVRDCVNPDGRINVASVKGKSGVNVEYYLYDGDPQYGASLIETLPDTVGGNKNFIDKSNRRYYVQAKVNESQCSLTAPILAHVSVVRPQVGSYRIFDATCFGEDGVIRMQDYRFDGITYSDTTNLSHFTFYLNNDIISVDTIPYDFLGRQGSHDIEILHNSSNCLSTHPSLTIAEPAQIEIDFIDADSVRCYGQANGEIRVRADNLTGNSASNSRTYTLIPDRGLPEQTIHENNTAVFSGLPAGNYQVRVNDGCQLNGVASRSVNVPGYPAISYKVEKKDFTCHNSYDGQIEIVPVRGYGNFDIYIDSVGASGVMANMTSSLSVMLNDTATFPITDASLSCIYRIEDVNGCSTGNDFDIRNPAPVRFNKGLSSLEALSCPGLSDGSAILAAEGGTEYLTFWIKPSITISYPVDSVKGTLIDGNSNAYENMFDNLSFGGYDVRVKDLNACQADTSFQINNPPAFTLNTPTVFQPTQCFTSDGEFNEYGSISVSANGIIANADFLVLQNGITVLDTTISGINDVANLALNQLIPASYEIEVTRNCLGENNLSVLETINSLDKMEMLPGDVIITDAFCGGANGHISIDEFFYGGQGNDNYAENDFAYFINGIQIADSATFLNYSDVAGTYNFKIVSMTDPNDNCDFDTTFTIVDGPLLKLSLEQYTIDCFSSDTTIGATVHENDVSGLISESPYTFYKNAIDSIGLAGTFDYHFNTPGSYNLYAISNIDSYCSTDTLTFINPAPLYIEDVQVVQPSLCYSVYPDGSLFNDEFGQITVTVGNLFVNGILPTFTLIDLANNTSIDSTGVQNGFNWEASFRPAPGTYLVEVRHSCPDFETTDTIVIESLPRPIINSDDINVQHAVCYNENGTININKFSFDGNDYTINDNVDDFDLVTEYYLGGIQQDTLSAANFFHYQNLGDNTYTLRVTDKTSRCFGENIASISQPDSVKLESLSLKLSCADKSNGEISVIAVDGTTSGHSRDFTLLGDTIITRSINIAPYEASFTGINAGTYTIRVEDGCTVAGSDEITNILISTYPEIDTTELYSEQMTCHDIEDGQIHIGASTGEPAILTFYLNNEGVGYAGNTFDGINYEYTFDGLNDQQEYHITVADENNCEQTFVAPEIINPPLLEITSNESSINHVNCWGGSDASIPVTASGGTGDIYFAIYEDDASDSTLYAPDLSYTFTNLNAGSKTIKIQDSKNCQALATYNVIQPDEYYVQEFSMDSVTCFGYNDGSMNISVIGGTPFNYGYNYELRDSVGNLVINKTGQNVEFEDYISGHYYVDIYDSRNCHLQSDTLELNQPEEMTITEHMTSATCYDSDDIVMTVDVTGGNPPYSYEWRDINNDIVGFDNSISAYLGVFFVEVVDNKQCGYGKIVPGLNPIVYRFHAQRPDTIKLFVDNQVDVDYYGQNNGSIILNSTGGWSYHKYSMDGIHYQPMPFFGGLAEGNHSFFVKDSSGCENSISTYISQPEPFVASIDTVSNVKCFGGSDGYIITSATGGIPPYNYSVNLTNGYIINQSGGGFNNLPEGYYTIEVGYKNYKQILHNIYISQPKKLVSEISNYLEPTCGYSDGWATVDGKGGTPPYIYSWSNQQTTQTAQNLGAGDFKVILQDNNSCSDSSNITLYNVAGPELLIDTIQNIPCYTDGDIGSIKVKVNGGTSPYQVVWNDPAEQQGLEATGLAVGIYSAMVTDANNCVSKIGSLSITKPGQLYLTLDYFKDPVCYNENNGELGFLAYGGTPPYTFEWPDYPNAGNSNTANGLAAGMHTINLTDASNCQTSENVYLLNPNEISFDLPDTVFICEGQFTTLDAGNYGMLYQWTSSNGFESRDREVIIREEGEYLLTISSIEGCQRSKSFHVKFENRLIDGGFLMASEANLLDTIVLVEISWPEPDSVQWFIPDGFSYLYDADNYKELRPANSGTYTIGLKAFYEGCYDFIEKQVVVSPTGRLKFGNDKESRLISKAKLFPNPNSGVFEVEIKLAEISDLRLDLYSMNGLKAAPTKFEYGAQEYNINYNVTNLQPGAYFINIVAGDEVRKVRFVVDGN